MGGHKSSTTLSTPAAVIHQQRFRLSWRWVCLHRCVCGNHRACAFVVAQLFCYWCCVSARGGAFKLCTDNKSCVKRLRYLYRALSALQCCFGFLRDYHRFFLFATGNVLCWRFCRGLCRTNAYACFGWRKGRFWCGLWHGLVGWLRRGLRHGLRRAQTSWL